MNTQKLISIAGITLLSIAGISCASLKNQKTTTMNTQKIKSFSVIGIAVRTTKENNQAEHDIRALWTKFMAENIMEKIPNKVDNSIYSIYTDYEKDHTKPYTTILGCKVENLNTIPTGMVGKKFENENYIKQTIAGNLMKGIVFNAWVDIWNLDIPRAYTADFEVYGEKAKNPENAEVDIFVAIK